MCEWGLQGEQGGPLGCPTVSEGREGDMTLGKCDSLRLCPQVELRSYVSEPELATFSGEMAQPSLGLVGPDSRYQTLPGRGKAKLCGGFLGAPTSTIPLLLSPHLVPHSLLPTALGLCMDGSCQGDSGVQGGPVLSSGLHDSLLLHLPPEIMTRAVTIKHSTVLSTLCSFS